MLLIGWDMCLPMDIKVDVCDSEWEISFERIHHRSSIIDAYAYHDPSAGYLQSAPGYEQTTAYTRAHHRPYASPFYAPEWSRRTDENAHRSRARVRPSSSSRYEDRPSSGQSHSVPSPVPPPKPDFKIELKQSGKRLAISRIVESEGRARVYGFPERPGDEPPLLRVYDTHFAADGTTDTGVMGDMSALLEVLMEKKQDAENAVDAVDHVQQTAFLKPIQFGSLAPEEVEAVSTGPVQPSSITATTIPSSSLTDLEDMAKEETVRPVDEATMESLFGEEDFPSLPPVTTIAKPDVVAAQRIPIQKEAPSFRPMSFAKTPTMTDVMPKMDIRAAISHDEPTRESLPLHDNVIQDSSPQVQVEDFNGALETQPAPADAASIAQRAAALKQKKKLRKQKQPRKMSDNRLARSSESSGASITSFSSTASDDQARYAVEDDDVAGDISDDMRDGPGQDTESVAEDENPALGSDALAHSSAESMNIPSITSDNDTTNMEESEIAVSTAVRDTDEAPLEAIDELEESQTQDMDPAANAIGEIVNDEIIDEESVDDLTESVDDTIDMMTSDQLKTTFAWLTQAHDEEEEHSAETLGEIAKERAMTVAEPRVMLFTLVIETEKRGQLIGDSLQKVLELLHEFQKSPVELGTRAFKKAVVKFRKRILSKITALDNMVHQHGRWMRYNRLVAAHIMKRLTEVDPRFANEQGWDMFTRLDIARKLFNDHEAIYVNMENTVRHDPRLFAVFADIA